MQDRAEAWGGLHDPAVTIRVGVDHFARLVAKHGVQEAFARWRGVGPDGEPGRSYAAHAMTLLPHWQRIVQEASMGYALLDRPNPTGPNFYTTRRNKLLGYLLHITAGLEDLDATDDQSAEGVVRYAQSTTRDVSWHVSSDTDSTIELLPPGYTAWHASAYNSTTYGHEMSKLNTDWRRMSSTWISRTLDQAAKHAAKICAAHGIPVRKATKAELDAAIAAGARGKPVGFLSHYEVDPGRRDDPGRLPGTRTDTFPWSAFLDRVRHYQAGGVDDDMYTDDDRNKATSVHIAVFGKTPAEQKANESTVADGSILTRLRTLEQGKDGSHDPGDVRATLDRIETSQKTPPPATVRLDEDQLAEVADQVAGRLDTSLARAVADELDRRARDNDPTTGPTS